MDPSVGVVEPLPAASRGRGRLPPSTTPSTVNGISPLTAGPNGPWRPRLEVQSQSPRELRRPRDPPQASLASMPPVSEGKMSPRIPTEEEAAGTKAASMLSPEAKEFVPRRRTQLVEPERVKEFVPMSRRGGGGASAQAAPPQATANSFNPASVREERWSQRRGATSLEEAAMIHLTEAMAHLTVNPASFDLLVKPLLESFAQWLSDEPTVLAVVAALFEQSIADANFRFSGARLCHALNDRFQGRFRTYLLNRCRLEHGRVLESLASDPQRAYGYLLFTADLFVTLELVRGSKQKIKILGQAVLDTVGQLLDVPTIEAVKCVCQTLKLAGHHLEEIESPQVARVFQRLHDLRAMPITAPSTIGVIDNICKLRQANWGISAPGHGEGSTAAPPSQPPDENGPTFYGPDGQVLTIEESKFLQDNISASTEQDDYDPYRDLVAWEPDDEMDDEIQTAFEQFLLIGKNKQAE